MGNFLQITNSIMLPSKIYAGGVKVQQIETMKWERHGFVAFHLKLRG